MKKLFLSILAVATLASCSKNEDFYTEINSEIKMAPVASISTRAYAPVYGSIDDVTYPTSENFKVTAYWTNAATSEVDKVYLNDVEFTNKGNYWGGTTTYYWPKNGYLRFACYSPKTVTGVSHVAATDTYTVNYTQSENTAATKDFMLSAITAPYTAETATENVAVVFEHALSWITIKVKAKNAEAAKAFKVHEVTVDQAFTNATLKAAMADGIQYAEWGEESTKGAKKDYTVYANAYPNGQDVTETLATIESLNSKGEYRNGTLVIPQVPTTLTIKYTQRAMPGTPELKDQIVTVPLELDDETKNIWEPGKHYVYTVIFDLDEILINPSVEDWEDVIVNDKDMDDKGYIATASTEAELKAALEAKVAEIEITKPIALTSQLAVNYNVAFKGGEFTGASIKVTGGVVSFTNVAFKNGNGANESSVYVNKNNTNITFDGCTFSEYTYEAIQYTSMTGKWINIVNCTFTSKVGNHRSIHIQPIGEEDNNGDGSNDSIETNTYLKMVNNQFNGSEPADSYVLVYGLFHKNMHIFGNTVDGNVTTNKIWFANGHDSSNLLDLDGRFAAL